jgi:hypothetical protein
MMNLALPLLRRLGLALGAYLAAFSYFDSTNMRTATARWVGLGLALFFFSLPRFPTAHPPPTDPRRGFEVVVPDQDPD